MQGLILTEGILQVYKVPDYVQPGDFAVVHVVGPLGNYLSYFEWLMGDTHLSYDHVLLYIGDGKCIEAMPWGVAVDSMDHPMHLLYTNYLWSSDYLFPTQKERTAIVSAAAGYVGTVYNYLEWVAAAAYTMNIWPWKQMLPTIMDSHLLMCSQLVAQSWQDGGYPLCGGRYAAYISPADLGTFCLEH